jgi:hypothetical protein
VESVNYNVCLVRAYVDLENVLFSIRHLDGEELNMLSKVCHTSFRPRIYKLDTIRLQLQ